MALYDANDSHLFTTRALHDAAPESGKSLKALLSSLRLNREADEILAELQCKCNAEAIAETAGGQVWKMRLAYDPSSGIKHLNAEDISDTYDDCLRKKILLDMAEKAPDFIAMAREDHTALWLNEAFLRGLEARDIEDVRDKKIEDVQPEGISSLSVEEALSQVREQGFLVTETLLTTPSGKYLGEYSQLISAQKDPLNNTWVYGTVLRDLGPRKAVELELESTRNKLQFLLDQKSLELEETTRQVYYGRDVWRSLVERHPHLVLFTMDNGEILFSNQAFLEESGFHLVGKSVFSLIEPDYTPALREAFQRVTEGEVEHVSIDAEIRTPGGSKRFCVAFINRLERQDGSHAATWLFSDATDAVRNRDHLLANEKMAATGRMAARIAHEINNPLSAIKGSLSLIRLDRGEDDPSLEYINLMEKELDRVSNIIRQMYGLYRPEQDPMRGIQLAEIVSDCCVLLQSSASMRGVRLEQNVEPAIRGYGAESSLRQVLFNVLNNAIDAAPPNTVIRIGSDAAPPHVRINVTDQGPGIESKVLERIFEPFFTTKESFSGGGLGLGLSVSISLMRGMGGDLNIENLPDGGTRATIALKSPGSE